MEDFDFSNIDQYLKYVGTKYGEDFVQRNLSVLKLLFKISRSLRYTDDEYDVFHEAPIE